jgi:hypothetical protein
VYVSVVYVSVVYLSVVYVSVVYLSVVYVSFVYLSVVYVSVVYLSVVYVSVLNLMKTFFLYGTLHSDNCFSFTEPFVSVLNLHGLASALKELALTQK